MTMAKDDVFHPNTASSDGVKSFLWCKVKQILHMTSLWGSCQPNKAEYRLVLSQVSYLFLSMMGPGQHPSSQSRFISTPRVMVLHLGCTAPLKAASILVTLLGPTGDWIMCP